MRTSLKLPALRNDFADMSVSLKNTMSANLGQQGEKSLGRGRESGRGEVFPGVAGIERILRLRTNLRYVKFRKRRDLINTGRITGVNGTSSRKCPLSCSPSMK